MLLQHRHFMIHVYIETGLQRIVHLECLVDLAKSISSHCGRTQGIVKTSGLTVEQGVPIKSAVFLIGGAESTAMKFHGNVRGEVRVNFLALVASKPHFHVWCLQIVPNCSCECLSFAISSFCSLN